MRSYQEGALPKLAPFFALSLLVIAYGSLFPFQFHPRLGDPWSALLATWHEFGSRGDLIANLLLYIPLGLSGALVLRGFPFVPRVALVGAGGAVLSLVMELAQFYDPGRDSALSDVYMNAAGAIAGALAAQIFVGRSRFLALSSLRRRPFLVLLFACWLGYRLFPFVPVIDLHKYWHAIQPLIGSGEISVADCYRYTAEWLALALLIEEVAGAWLRLAVWAAVAVVTLVRIAILGIVLSRAEVLGGLLAAALWSGALARCRSRSAIIAALFAGAVAVQGLAPFHFSPDPRAFVWIPFWGFLHGSISINIVSFFEKFFLYGTLVWVLARAGIRRGRSTALACALVLVVHFLQVYLPGRSAEVTDALLCLFAAATMKWLGEDPASRAATVPNPGLRSATDGWSGNAAPAGPARNPR
ncbi:MAG TPA: VanZ family protein [Bryobacteraceae bacterium]|nr:VanZ family protein [Bryobacteraceae bacterium]